MISHYDIAFIVIFLLICLLALLIDNKQWKIYISIIVLFLFSLITLDSTKLCNKILSSILSILIGLRIRDWFQSKNIEKFILSKNFFTKIYPFKYLDLNGYEYCLNSYNKEVSNSIEQIKKNGITSSSLDELKRKISHKYSELAIIKTFINHIASNIMRKSKISDAIRFDIKVEDIIYTEEDYQRKKNFILMNLNMGSIILDFNEYPHVNKEKMLQTFNDIVRYFPFNELKAENLMQDTIAIYEDFYRTDLSIVFK